MSKRKYRLKRRAVEQRKTRDRIVDATVALHRELGPRATTITAVAERAGVQRLTVYRHFPTEKDLFEACSSTFLDRHPPPDPGDIEESGAAARTRAVLRALYAYYAETAEMWTSVYRDEGLSLVAESLGGFEEYLENVRADLLKGYAPYRSRRLRATLAHAVRFSTWQSLHEQGLGPREMADVVSSWADASVRQT